MTRQTGVSAAALAAASVVFAFQGTGSAFQAVPAAGARAARVPGDAPPGGTKSKPLDPRGRMEDHPTDKPARYYLWHDQHGWHLRSCSRVFNKFEGTLRVEGGEMKKCRPIGIDARGRNPDRWSLDEKRTELKFLLNTAQSFDGFDFTVDDAQATIEFELLINGKPMPARIFVGRDGEHPKEPKFTFPGDPEQLDAEQDGAAEQPPARQRTPAGTRPRAPRE